MAEISLRDFKVMAEEDKRRERRYMAFRREEAKKIESMNCALLKYLREQHNLHPHQTLVLVTFQSVTLLHQRVHIGS